LKIEPRNQLNDGRFATDGKPKTEDRTKMVRRSCLLRPRSAAKLPTGPRTRA